jgi:N-acetylgalactosamine kinase
MFASRNAAKLLEIEHQEDMLTFSTRPELRAISRHFLPTASHCLAAIRRGEWDGVLSKTYGDNAVSQAARRYIDLLEAFLKRHGDRTVMMARAPGRVNLMGRHIDHRGGCTNVMTIDKDTLVVASPRDDGIVTAANLDDAYPSTEFSIAECLALGGDAGDWLSYLEVPAVIAEREAHRGEWGNYIKSAVLRFQMAQDIPLCGMDMLVTGDIPVAAGLSSSSSVVVATAELLMGLNCLNISTRQFIDLCGEGEWFVGSRGGASDHAAMKCGQRNFIRQLKFKPFTVGGSYPFSENCSVIVADSGQKARKSSDSKDVFNARVAAYECAFMLLRKAYPQRGWREFRELAEVPEDVEIYRMLKTLPLRATRDEILKLLPAQGEALGKIFATHRDLGPYELRGVALYGISECRRAALFGELLEKKDYAAIGEMMNISHDGDRLEGQDCSDQALDALIASQAPLWRQFGAYRCSTQRIDEMCDLLKGTGGVLGCSIAGAGLGGSVIALVESNRAASIIEVLNDRYYKKYGLQPGAGIYRPGVGSGIVNV